MVVRALCDRDAACLGSIDAEEKNGRVHGIMQSAVDTTTDMDIMSTRRRL